MKLEPRYYREYRIEVDVFDNGHFYATSLGMYGVDTTLIGAIISLQTQIDNFLNYTPKNIEELGEKICKIVDVDEGGNIHVIDEAALEILINNYIKGQNK